MSTIIAYLLFQCLHLHDLILTTILEIEALVLVNWRLNNKQSGLVSLSRRFCFSLQQRALANLTNVWKTFEFIVQYNTKWNYFWWKILLGCFSFSMQHSICYFIVYYYLFWWRKKHLNPHASTFVLALSKIGLRLHQWGGGRSVTASNI